MFDYDVRIYAIADIRREFMMDDFAKFPNEVFWAIAKKVYSTIRNGKKVRVTSENGTDLSGDVHPLHVTGLSRDIDPAPGLPGAFNVWPGGNCETHLEGDINGRIVYDQLDGFGRLREPVILTVEHHWVTKIEGQKDAVEWLSKKAFEIKNANYFAETSTGLNPKARIRRALKEGSFELSRRAGTVHFGIGKSTTLGGRIWADFHWDGLLFYPNYYVDDFCLIDRGHLTVLDDPEIRSLASKYGDPDKILSYIDWAD
jgi:leucyl aminopeptidase (aminopeptidase T)